MEPDVNVIWIRTSGGDTLNVTVIPATENPNDNITWSISYRLVSAFNRKRYYKMFHKDCGICEDPSRDFPCDCPEYTDGTKTCLFSNDCLLAYHPYAFYIEGTAAHGTVNRTKEVTVNSAISQLPGVKVSDGYDANARTATLKWERYTIFGQAYQISYRYRSNWDVDWNNWTEFSYKDEAKEKRRTVLYELTPYSKYTVEYRCKLPASVNWNRGQKIHITTKQDAPDSAPLITNGAYTVGNGALGNGDQCNKVFLYLKPVPPKRRNGNITRYKVAIKHVGGLLEEENGTVAFTLAGDTLVIDQKEQSPEVKKSDFVIDVWATNDIGTSRNSSGLQISGNYDMLKSDDVVVEQINESAAVRITWSSSSYKWYRKVSRVTLHSCLSKKVECGIVTCQSEYDWVILNSSTSSYDYDDYDARDGPIGQYRFGISVEFENRSGGVTWSDPCLYSMHAVPGTPSNVLKWDYTANGLRIIWTKPICESGQGYAWYYNVSYSKLPNSEAEMDCERGHFLRTKGTETNMTLPGVEESERYGFCVRAGSRGRLGKWSMPKEAGSSDGAGGEDNTLIAVFAVVGIAVGIVALLVLARWCWRVWQKSAVAFQDPPRLDEPAYDYTVVVEDETTDLSPHTVISLDVNDTRVVDDETMPLRPQTVLRSAVSDYVSLAEDETVVVRPHTVLLDPVDETENGNTDEATSYARYDEESPYITEEIAQILDKTTLETATTHSVPGAVVESYVKCADNSPYISDDKARMFPARGVEDSTCNVVLYTNLQPDPRSAKPDITDAREEDIKALRPHTVLPDPGDQTENGTTDGATSYAKFGDSSPYIAESEARMCTGRQDGDGSMGLLAGREPTRVSLGEITGPQYVASDRATPDKATHVGGSTNRTTPDRATPKKLTLEIATPHDVTPGGRTLGRTSPGGSTSDRLTQDRVSPDGAEEDFPLNSLECRVYVNSQDNPTNSKSTENDYFCMVNCNRTSADGKSPTKSASEEPYVKLNGLSEKIEIVERTNSANTTVLGNENSETLPDPLINDKNGYSDFPYADD